MSRATIAMYDGETMDLDAWSCGVPGLCIVPFVWSDGEIEAGWYRITHRGSGLSVGPYAYPSRAAAKRAALAAAEILDWTEPFTDLREHPRLDDVKAACKVKGWRHEIDLALAFQESGESNG